MIGVYNSYTHKSIVGTKRAIAANNTCRIILGMSETWVDRARERMKSIGKTQSDLAGPLGVKTRSAVGHYFSGRRKLSADQVAGLARALQCSIDYLLTGENPIKRENIELSHRQRTMLDLLESLTDRQQDLLIQETRQIKHQNDELYEELQKKKKHTPTNHDDPLTQREDPPKRPQKTLPPTIVATDSRARTKRLKEKARVIGKGKGEKENAG